MGIQLKPGLFKPNFNLNEVCFDDIIASDANTRYRYAIAKISKSGKVYVIKKKNKFIFYKDEESGCRVVNIWPNGEPCIYCKENDELFGDGEIVCFEIKEFYHSVLSEWHKKKCFRLGLFETVKKSL